MTVSPRPFSLARHAWIDWAKAIGIVLVVYGHSQGVPMMAEKIIYSFHLPLFFFISGFLLGERKIELPFPTYARELAASLLPPYLILAPIGYLAWFFVLRRFGNDATADVPAGWPLFGILYGSAKTDYLLKPPVLWFFPCLLVSSLLAWPICRLKAAGLRFGVCAGAALLGWLGASLVLPGQLEVALVAVGFVVLGVESNRRGLMRQIENRSYFWGLLLVLGGCAIGLLNRRIDMRTSHFGNLVLFEAAAILWIAGLAWLLKGIRPHALIQKLASNTVVIFPLHIFVFAAFAAVYVFGFGLPLKVRELPWVALLASFANLALILALVPLIRRLCPAVYGVKLQPHVPSAAKSPRNQ